MCLCIITDRNWDGFVNDPKWDVRVWLRIRFQLPFQMKLLVVWFRWFYLNTVVKMEIFALPKCRHFPLTSDTQPLFGNFLSQDVKSVAPLVFVIERSLIQHWKALSCAMCTFGIWCTTHVNKVFYLMTKMSIPFLGKKNKNTLFSTWIGHLVYMGSTPNTKSTHGTR